MTFIIIRGAKIIAFKIRGGIVFKFAGVYNYIYIYIYITN